MVDFIHSFVVDAFKELGQDLHELLGFVAFGYFVNLLFAVPAPAHIAVPYGVLRLGLYEEAAYIGEIYFAFIRVECLTCVKKLHAALLEAVLVRLGHGFVVPLLTARGRGRHGGEMERGGNAQLGQLRRVIVWLSGILVAGENGDTCLREKRASTRLFNAAVVDIAGHNEGGRNTKEEDDEAEDGGREILHGIRLMDGWMNC